MLPPPSATNPRILGRVLEQVAAGHRRPRALAEVLGMEVRALQSYLVAAEWLGFLSLEGEPALTRGGLEYVYAGTRRPAVFADVVRAHPFFRDLGEGAPALDALANAIRATDPELSTLSARRRAGALRRLVEPAWRTRRVARPERQLGLDFASPAGPRRGRVDLRAGTDDNPDVYTVVLRALLDHGELSPPQLRAVLDGAGGGDCGLGGYLLMAERRGDARRVGDVLVVTRGAVARRDLADSAVSVALSDPDFRRHLAEVDAGRPGDGRRFRSWTARLFGGERPEEALDRLLFGRSLASFPLAGDPGEPASGGDPEPFLAAATRRDLVVAFPSSLLALTGGVAGVNRALRIAVQQGAAARLPGPLDRRTRVHAGLLHPGEVAPRAVPDMISLRARALRNAPAFALLGALAALDRRGALRVRVRGPELHVEAPGAAPRRMDQVVDALAAARGWIVARGPDSPPWGHLADVGEQLGLFAQPAGFLTLEEGFFRRLQADPEHRDLWDALTPLADLLDARAGRKL